MCMTRALKRLISFGLIGLLLFAQLAIAAYACPELSGVPQSSPMKAVGTSNAAMPAATSDMAAMPGCDQIDDSAANLCVEHCRVGQQSADHAPAPSVPAALPSLLYTLPAQPEALGPVRPVADASLRQVAASLPHAILHCCFRI